MDTTPMPYRGLTCTELVELVTEYLDGALAAEQRRRCEEHIVTCAGCAQHLAEFRRTILLTGRLTEELIEPETRDALLRAFRDWRLSASSRPQPGRHGA
jgi:anti-sigma factor RsiW